MPSAERRPQVLRSPDGSFIVRKIPSDTDPTCFLNILVTAGGDVGVSIFDPQTGIVSIDLVPQGRSANPDVATSFRNFAHELAEQIENSGE